MQWEFHYFIQVQIKFHDEVFRDLGAEKLVPATGALTVP